MAKASSRRVLVVRFMQPGVNLEGQRTSYVRADKTGRHNAYEIAETERGVELSKLKATPDASTVFIPWARIELIEYGDG